MPAHHATPQFRTVGSIAREFGVPIHRITHILRTRSHIRPAAMAGNTRVFDNAAVARLRHEINAIDARRLSRQEAESHA